MAVLFKKASKQKAKLRAALIGPSGSGKTYSMLAVACAMGQKVAVIDTEHGSASKYADLFAFDVLELDSFSPTAYVQGIHAAEAAGYDVIGIDSLSHAWSGKDGVLEFVDTKAKQSRSSNSYVAWREATPLHNQLVEAIIQSKCHVIATMRTKTEYVQERDERTGKVAPRKIGLQPVQRDGLEYEFDVVADIDLDHALTVSKTRCPALTDKVFRKPGADLAKILIGWLSDGVDPAPAPVLQAVSAPKPEPVVEKEPTDPSPEERQETRALVDAAANIPAAAATLGAEVVHKQTAAERKRAADLFHFAMHPQHGNKTEATYKAWVAAVLGKYVPTKELTSEQMDKLEADINPKDVP